MRLLNVVVSYGVLLSSFSHASDSAFGDSTGLLQVAATYVNDEPKEFVDDFFEGPEKTLMLKFGTSHLVQGSLRNLPDEAWRDVMHKMGIAILSKVETSHHNGSSTTRGTEGDTGCTAYLLSESSLFVYHDRVVFKTCGLSSPLRGLSLFLDVARGPAASADVGLEQVLYSHPAFMRQEEQSAPHRSWDDEVAFLKALFPAGVERRLGTPDHGTDIFAANFATESTTPWVVAEIYITDLEQPTAQTSFARESKATISAFWNATSPDKTDEFYFEPSGYSANLLHGNAYATMHASPQPSVSYISHATNVLMSSQELQQMVDRTVMLARGRHIGVFLFAFSPAKLLALPMATDGYIHSGAWEADGPGFQTSLLSLTKALPATCSTIDSAVQSTAAGEMIGMALAQHPNACAEFCAST